MKAVLIFLPLLAWNNLNALAEIQKVTMEIEGLDNHSLAAELRSRLLNVKGITNVSVFRDEDRLDIEVKPDQEVALAEIERGTTESEFFPGYWGSSQGRIGQLQ